MGIDIGGTPAHTPQLLRKNRGRQREIANDKDGDKDRSHEALAALIFSATCLDNLARIPNLVMSGHVRVDSHAHILRLRKADLRANHALMTQAVKVERVPHDMAGFQSLQALPAMISNKQMTCKIIKLTKNFRLEPKSRPVPIALFWADICGYIFSCGFCAIA